MHNNKKQQHLVVRWSFFLHANAQFSTTVSSKLPDQCTIMAPKRDPKQQFSVQIFLFLSRSLGVSKHCSPLNDRHLKHSMGVLSVKRGVLNQKCVQNN